MASPSSVGFVARMTSANGLTVGGASGDTLDQLADAQPLGSDAVDGRDGPVQDVVEAAERARALEGQHVERLLDDAQPVAVAARRRDRWGRAVPMRC